MRVHVERYRGFVKTLGFLLADITGLAGLAAVVYGVHLIYHPAAWIVGGLIGVAAATAAARAVTR